MASLSVCHKSPLHCAGAHLYCECTTLQPTVEHCRQQILLQINTHLLSRTMQLNQTFAIQKQLCGHYLRVSSFAQMFQGHCECVLGYLLTEWMCVLNTLSLHGDNSPVAHGDHTVDTLLLTYSCAKQLSWKPLGGHAVSFCWTNPVHLCWKGIYVYRVEWTGLIVSWILCGACIGCLASWGQLTVLNRAIRVECSQAWKEVSWI